MVFWRKKQLAAEPAAGGSTAPASVAIGPGAIGTPKAHAEEKEVQQKSPSPASIEVQILTRKEIEERISQLSEPGSIVFFYLSGSPASGGPLGQGAAVIELNPDYPGKNQKKYTLYVDHVDGLQPVGKRQKMITSDKARELASWVKDRHNKR